MRAAPDAEAERLAFLPMSCDEMAARGWDEFDILLVGGDAYVDHPAFGLALIGRYLESRGFRVGMIAQPDWRDARSVAALGRPRLFAGVSAGAVDSMLNLYTGNRKRRSDDDYSPGGRGGLRPARATIAYTHLLGQAFPGLPVVIGGIEASLRRLAHYDYWADRVRASILLDSGADLLVYGMGERAVLEAARRIDAGAANGLRFIPGTVFAGAESDLPGPGRTVWLPSREEIESEPAKLVEATVLASDHVNPFSRNYLAQRDGERLVIETEPQRPLRTAELDALYDLPFTRRAHWSYAEPVPALETVRFSVTVHRGCYGGCTFCGLGFHQGKVIQSRSVESIVREVERIGKLPGFRGIITDLGGPTANMYGTGCSAHLTRTLPPTEMTKPEWRINDEIRMANRRGESIAASTPSPSQGEDRVRVGDETRMANEELPQPATKLTDGNNEPHHYCRRTSCLFPQPCVNLDAAQTQGLRMLAAVRALPCVRQAFIASGIRYDLAMLDARYVEEVAAHHTGGHLSVAPEHCVNRVLRLMGKPDIEVFGRFRERFESASRAAGKEQYLVPYLISSFPGCTDADMAELRAYLGRSGLRTHQTQDFTPTPMTLATAMYYSGRTPDGRAIPVARTPAARRKQQGYLRRPGGRPPRAGPRRG